MVSSIREKIYQVEKEKKVERRKAKEKANNPEPVFKEVKEPEVEKVVDSGEVKAKGLVEGVSAGCFPQLYEALGSNPPDQVITL